MSADDSDSSSKRDAAASSVPSDLDATEPSELAPARRAELMQIFKRGAEFSEELLRENERLRFRVAEFEGRGSDGSSEDGQFVQELLGKLQRFESSRQEMQQRYQDAEAENRDFASRYQEIEEENNRLMNIYVASYQLHSTLDFGEVLRIITEISLNFMGAERFGIVLHDAERNELRPLLAEGMTTDALRELSPKHGCLPDVLGKGVTYVAPNLAESTDVTAPIVCVPMRIRESVLGCIVIYKFLQQKDEVESVDHELFALLEGHAAAAIFSAKLYTDSQRRMSTIQELIDLVTS